MKSLISYLLLIVLFSHHIVMIADVCFADKFTEASNADVVCGCTCCGDVCPMGEDCCCYTPLEKKIGSFFTKNDCNPYHDSHIASISLFKAKAVWFSIKHVNTNVIVQFFHLNLPGFAHQFIANLPTPPPNKHI